MKIEIDYERARTGYPGATEETIAGLRNGKSKHRKAAPETLKWYFTWGVTGRAYSFQEVMDGTARADDAAHRKRTVEERIADRVGRVFAHVEAVVPTGHSYFGGGKRLDPVPDEIVQSITESVVHSYGEEQRVAALSDEERTIEAGRILGELRGTPGFVAL